MNLYRKSTLALAAALVLASVAVQAAPVEYHIDPDHTDVVATWSHLGFSNPMAHFGDVDGVIKYDAQNVANSSVMATIPLTGLNSHVQKFDEHLRSAELFDMAKFPTITFKSTNVEDAGNKQLKVTGDLTIRGVTKSVVLHATLNGQGEHPMSKRQAIGFDAMTSVKRSDFGVAYAAPAVSDEVTIRITTEAQAR